MLRSSPVVLGGQASTVISQQKVHVIPPGQSAILAASPKLLPGSPSITAAPGKGTPLEDQEAVPFEDLLRMIDTARITMPKSMVRLSAGRLERSRMEQGFCFMAGANSIFAGDKLLTTPNPAFNQDMDMFQFFGLTAMPSIHEKRKEVSEVKV